MLDYFNGAISSHLLKYHVWRMELNVCMHMNRFPIATHIFGIYSLMIKIVIYESHSLKMLKCVPWQFTSKRCGTQLINAEYHIHVHRYFSKNKTLKQMTNDARLFQLMDGSNHSDPLTIREIALWKEGII